MVTGLAREREALWGMLVGEGGRVNEQLSEHNAGSLVPYTTNPIV
jgi:hypothetical protein